MLYTIVNVVGAILSDVSVLSKVVKNIFVCVQSGCVVLISAAIICHYTKYSHLFCAVLRMEQDVEKFIRDPIQQQLEFQQLPTSYLRLAAHRVAQHYALQSMVLLDNNLPDGSGSRIIVRKTPECRLPLIRLADITVSLLSEESGVTKVAIKQRPQKRSQMANSGGSNSSKGNSSKSVEERKEEYNRACV